MEVIIFSALPDHEGRFTLQVDPSQTIQKVIKAFCAENEIKFRSDYVLKSRSQEEFNKKRPLCAYGIQSGDEFYLSIQDDGRWACGCNHWWVLVALCLVIGCVGIIVVSILHSQNYDPVYSYGIGIDAGSSHTKLYVYRWLTGKSNGTGIVDEIFTCPTSPDTLPPISSFTHNTSEAGRQCVKPCLDKVLSVIPSREHSKTPVLLGATAGMRLLRYSDNASTEAIMLSVRETISSFPFLFNHPTQQARIIEGNEEGTFGWISANYLSGTLGFQPMGWITNLWSSPSLQSLPNPTIGALDMGGASTQISFLPENPSSIVTGYNSTVMLYGVNYNIYTYSYLCYGLNEAYKRHMAELIKLQGVNATAIIHDPCRPKDYNFSVSFDEIFQIPCTLSEDDPKPENVTVTFVGQSDTQKCNELTMRLFNKSVPCDHSPCTFDGIYQPPLYNNFLAFSGFYYTMRFLNLTQNFSRADFEVARDSHCNKSYSEIRMHTSRYLVSYCFNSHFIYNLLINGYGFNDTNWNSIQFNNRANGAEIGWILGMMINTTNIIPVAAKTEMIFLPVFIILLVLFTIILLLSIAFLIHARRWNHHQYRALPTTSEAV